MEYWTKKWTIFSLLDKELDSDYHLRATQKNKNTDIEQDFLSEFLG